MKVREWLDPGRTRSVMVNFGSSELGTVTLVNRYT